MKNVLKGITFLFSGVLIVGFTLIASAIYAQAIDEWDSRYGKFGTSLRDINGIVFLVISLVFIAIGIYYFYKDIKAK